jgi:putative ABC transport system permease protein
MRPFLFDLTFALRALRRTPFFTWIAIATLALPIGFNSLIFSVVNAVLLKSAPYPEARELVVLEGRERDRKVAEDLAAPTFFFVQEHARLLENVAASDPIEVGVNVTGTDTPTYVKALRVSKNFFRVLRTAPFTGRTFVQTEDEPNGPRVAVLSYGLWRTSFGSRSGKIVLRINGEPYTVIGVMPQTFRSYPEADLWLPLQLSPATADPGKDYRVIARLQKGVSIQRAREELRELSANYPLASIPAAQREELNATELQDFETDRVRGRLIFLLSGAFLVLLIAWANVAMLLLVRASARAHEIGVRAALGSPKKRIIQVFVLESSVISLLGGLFGIIIAKELLPVVQSLSPSIPQMSDIYVDLRVVAFTFAMAAITGALFGIVPIFKLHRFELNEMLGETRFRSTGSRRQTRTGRLLLVTQTALTMILLSGSMLLFRHLLAVEHIEPGFETRGTYVAQVSLGAQSYQTTAPTCRTLDRLMQMLADYPSVNGVATINGLPLEEGLNMPVRSAEAPEDIESAEYRLVSRDYFSVMQIPLIQGRSFAATDQSDTQPVAIVNQRFARRWWPGAYVPGHVVVVGEAMGKEYAERPKLVIGVVADVHQSSLEAPARPTIFVPMQQASDKITAYANRHFLTSILVKTTNGEDITKAVRDAVGSADPDLSLASLRPLSLVVTKSLARDRFYALLTITFGAFGLLITAMALYALMSYYVELRKQEIAVRISVGCQRWRVVILVVGQGMQLVGTAILLGIAVSFFFNRAFGGMFYNLRGMWSGALRDASLLLALVCLLASALTALEIVSIDPIDTLRNQ